MVKGFGYLIRYHLGTVAFGALVIGIVRLVRALIAFIQKHLKQYDNAFVNAILWCCQCCLWCFECALKFLTRNAYIETGKKTATFFPIIESYSITRELFIKIKKKNQFNNIFLFVNVRTLYTRNNLIFQPYTDATFAQAEERRSKLCPVTFYEWQRLTASVILFSS